MRNSVGRQGQSTFEIALVIVVVAAAAIAMSIFMKRSVMGKLRESGDQIGGQFTPLKFTSHRETKGSGDRDETLGFSGFAETKAVTETRTQTGNEHVTQRLDDETLFK